MKIFIILLLIIPIYFLLRIIYILLICFIDYVLDKKTIKKYSENIQKIILYINEKTVVDDLMDIFENMYDKILIINIDNICKESIENEIYIRKKLNIISMPCLVFIGKRKIGVIKLYNIIHITKNKLKKRRKLKNKITEFIENNYYMKI